MDIQSAVSFSIYDAVSQGNFYSIDIRKQGLSKLSRMPLGAVQAKGSGELKNILVERVDSIEPTLAHVLPEMSSNAMVVLATLCYLFVLDWRMALASLITLPL